MNTLPANNLSERVEQLILDWKGQDEMFYHDSTRRTIIWYVGKVKSYLQASAEIRTGDRTKFMEVVCHEYGMEPRRLQEAVAVYKKEALPSDSVMETSERIFQRYGGWSKALPAKPEKEKIEPICGKCPLHCGTGDVA